MNEHNIMYIYQNISSPYFQASLVITKASEDASATRALIQQDAQEARAYGNYGDNEKEIVIDIDDDEKKQYYETNYETSK